MCGKCFINDEMCHKLEKYGMLPVRLAVGAIFMAHGAQKLFGAFGGSGLHGTIEAFRTYLGIPAFLTVIAACTEFFGGLAVALGLLTRLAAAGLSVLMLVAILKVHLHNGFFLNWFNVPNQGHGIEYSLALLGACLTLVLSGSKGLSLNCLCHKKCGDDKHPETN